MLARCAACATLLALALGPARVAAQDARAEAGEHFQRGLRLYEEGRDEAALAELEEAHRLSPAWQVLYNIGRVHARLGHAVEAADSYERYLRDGGEEIEAARRAEVEELLAEQRARIALVSVRVNAEGAVILLDGADFARTPLEGPLRVAAGAHTIGARAEGHDTVTQRVRLAGGVERELVFDLPRAESLARVRVRSAVPGVAVFVDGREAGRTPMREDVPLDPGEHVIEGRREGYLTAREVVQAGEGQSLESTLEMRADPDARRAELRLRLPDAAGTVFVDGEAVATPREPVSLIAGPHRLRVELAGRRPLDETVSVAAGGLDYAPALRWRDDERQARLDAAATQRILGWALAGVGVALLAGGVIWAAVGSTSGDATDEEIERFEFCESQPDPRPVRCSVPDGYTEELRYRVAGVLSDRELSLGLGIGLASLGLVAGVVGLAVALASPSDSDIDGQARVSVRLGPGSVALEGTF